MRGHGGLGIRRHTEIKIVLHNVTSAVANSVEIQLITAIGWVYLLFLH